MIDAREPLHQPPNPDDLRRAPPAGPECARVRGWLRDYVDGDLEAPRARELEEHVHRCRVCNVELARAEHELLCVRQAFRELRAAQPVLPPDFAARVVERLVVDETSLVSPESLDRAVAARTAVAGDAARVPGPTPVPAIARRSFRPGVALVAAIAMLLLVGVGLELLRGPGRGPDCSAQLYLLSADGSYRIGQPLGEHQSLRVTSGGGVHVEWHDRNAHRPQPAARLQLRGNGEVRVENGQPLLVDGTIDITTQRAVSIPLADGSSIGLGIGEYTIAAEGGLYSDNPMHAAPGDLLITVEVRSGQPASVVRTGFAPTLVSVGQFGVYEGSRDMTVSAAGGGSTRPESASAERVPAGTAPTAQHVLLGQARDQNGLPIADGGVILTVGRGGQPRVVTAQSNAQGGFLCDLGASAEGSYVVAHALPPTNRLDLGMFAPDAVPLMRAGEAAMLLAPVVFARSIPFVGYVRDTYDVPLGGVRVVPCIVDEVFGTVLPLIEERRVSDDTGTFRLDRLPGRLPPQQALYLVLFHEDTGATSVAIPARGSFAAELPFPPITMPRLRTVRVHGLPPQQPVQVIEEIPGLPRGAGLRRRVYPQGLGEVGGWTQVGRGALSLLDPQTGTVRSLELEPATGYEAYRPSLAAPEPWAWRFRDVIRQPGTEIELAYSYRHQNAFQGVANGAATRTISVLDVAGNPIGGAQVFITDGLTPAAMAGARFAGFTAPNGLLGWNEFGGSQVLAITSDGRVGSHALVQGAGGNVSVEVPACGRVVLGAARRPSPNDAPIVELRFEPFGGDPALRGPAVVRFAIGPTWDVRDLPPGEYRVVIGNSAQQIDVPANGGFVELQ